MKIEDLEKVCDLVEERKRHVILHECLSRYRFSELLAAWTGTSRPEPLPAFTRGPARDAVLKALHERIDEIDARLAELNVTTPPFPEKQED